jgi:hypothetical protein
VKPRAKTAPAGKGLRPESALALSLGLPVFLQKTLGYEARSFVELIKNFKPWHVDKVEKVK